MHRFICGLALGLTVTAGAASAQVQLDKLTLPEGFSIEVYAPDVPNARSMARSPGGTLFVSTRRAGNVYAVLDTDQDHRADEMLTLASGLNMPNGVAFRDGSLYVAEVNRILRYDGIESRLQDPPDPVVVDDGFSRPTGRTAGSSSASGPTASCTSRWARRATSATGPATTSATPPSPG